MTITHFLSRPLDIHGGTIFTFCDLTRYYGHAVDMDEVMVTSDAVPSNTRSSIEALRFSFLDLPTEVRHGIYKYLFRHKQSPLRLINAAHIKRMNHYHIYIPVTSEPTFYTSLFRVNKVISEESLRFAYSQNDFSLAYNFEDFCSLSQVALSSIKGLQIEPTSRFYEFEPAWQKIKSKCSNLTYLEFDQTPDLIFQALPELLRKLDSSCLEGRRPCLTLDLYVWSTHFVFDPPRLEHRRTTQLLNAVSKSGQSRNDGASHAFPIGCWPYDTIGLAQIPATIVLSADVSPDSLQALDKYLEDREGNGGFIKTTGPLPGSGRRCEGRAARWRYTYLRPLT